MRIGRWAEKGEKDRGELERRAAENAAFVKMLEEVSLALHETVSQQQAGEARRKGDFRGRNDLSVVHETSGHDQSTRSRSQPADILARARAHNKKNSDKPAFVPPPNPPVENEQPEYYLAMGLEENHKHDNVSSEGCRHPCRLNLSQRQKHARSPSPSQSPSQLQTRNRPGDEDEPQSPSQPADYIRQGEGQCHEQYHCHNEIVLQEQEQDQYDMPLDDEYSPPVECVQFPSDWQGLEIEETTDDDMLERGREVVLPRQLLSALPPRPSTCTSRESTVDSQHVAYAGKKMCIEVAPGVTMAFRGSEETCKAITANRICQAVCLGCTIPLYCIDDAELVVCPECQTISPVNNGDGARQANGLGIGFKQEQLLQWTSEL